MPSNGSLDIPHVSVHDHYIRKPIEERTKSDIRKFIGIACINEAVPDPISKGRAFIAYFERFGFNKYALDSAKKYFPYQTPQSLNKNYKDVIHILFLEKNYTEIMRIVSIKPGILNELKTPSFDNRDAWTAYRIGEAFASTGNGAAALQYFETANRLAPYVIDFTNKFASALAAAGNNAKAKSILEQLVYEYPKNATSLANLGFLVLVLDRDTARAGSLYEKALEMDPDHEQAIVNKAGLLSFRGKNSEALKILMKYIKRNPQSQKAKSAFEQIERL